MPPVGTWARLRPLRTLLDCTLTERTIRSAYRAIASALARDPLLRCRHLRLCARDTASAPYSEITIVAGDGDSTTPRGAACDFLHKGTWVGPGQTNSDPCSMSSGITLQECLRRAEATSPLLRSSMANRRALNQESSVTFPRIPRSSLDALLAQPILTEIWMTSASTSAP